LCGSCIRNATARTADGGKRCSGLAVKPNIFDGIVPEITGSIGQDRFWYAIAAGISMEYIEKLLNKEGAKIVRVMPNTLPWSMKA
jgi:pyrroline-5-carboxylate reductase